MKVDEKEKIVLNLEIWTEMHEAKEMILNAWKKIKVHHRRVLLLTIVAHSIEFKHSNDGFNVEIGRGVLKRNVLFVSPLG
jgi:hypothetical protein